ncbi:MAG: hypothetical protein Q9192_007024 [Flavoplaca navasiana]
MDERHIPMMNYAAAYGETLAILCRELGDACLWFVADVCGGKFGNYSLSAWPKDYPELIEAVAELRMLGMNAKVEKYDLKGKAEEQRWARIQHLKMTLGRVILEKARQQR